MNLSHKIQDWWANRQTARVIRRLGLTSRSPLTIPLKPQPSVLVVRLDRVGDVLLTTPLLHALKHLLGAKVSVAVSPYASEILMDNPDVDEVLVGEEGRDLRHRRFDAAIDPFSGFLLRNALVCWESGAPIRLGYASQWAPYFFTDWLDAEPACYEAHRHLKFVEMLSPSPYPLPQGERGKFSSSPLMGEERGGGGLPRLMPGAFAEQSAEAIWREAGWMAEDIIVAVNPGSRRSAHRWGTARYAWVADCLVERHQAKVLMTWGPGERDLAKEVAGLMRYPSRVAPATTVKELAAVFRRVAVVVCADSGPFHVAVSQATPVAVVFGGSDATRWAPPDVPWVKTLLARRMAEVSRESVLEACEQLLQTSPLPLRERVGVRGS